MASGSRYHGGAGRWRCPPQGAPGFQPRARRAGAGVKEEELTMGDKGKGKDSGKAKKPKAAKVGNRPHEKREREGVLKKVPG
jgi:hypothetical protein